VTTAYLSGPMEYSVSQGIRWRRWYEKRLKKVGVKCIVPNDLEQDVLSSLEVPLAELKLTNRERYKEIVRRFLITDLEEVGKSDFVIVKWTGEMTAGTPMEAIHAVLRGIPVYLITGIPLDRVPGSLLSCCTEEFHSLEALIEHLENNGLEGTEEEDQEEDDDGENS